MIFSLMNNMNNMNNMNKLIEMYNAVKLIEDHWCFQRYVWQKDLDMIPEENIIKTLIYRVS